MGDFERKKAQEALKAYCEVVNPLINKIETVEKQGDKSEIIKAWSDYIANTEKLFAISNMDSYEIRETLIFIRYKYTPSMYLYRGKLYEQMGDDDNAIKDFKKSLENIDSSNSFKYFVDSDVAFAKGMIEMENYSPEKRKAAKEELAKKMVTLEKKNNLKSIIAGIVCGFILLMIGAMFHVVVGIIGLVGGFLIGRSLFGEEKEKPNAKKTETKANSVFIEYDNPIDAYYGNAVFRINKSVYKTGEDIQIIYNVESAMKYDASIAIYRKDERHATDTWTDNGGFLNNMGVLTLKNPGAGAWELHLYNSKDYEQTDAHLYLRIPFTVTD